MERNSGSKSQLKSKTDGGRTNVYSISNCQSLALASLPSTSLLRVCGGQIELITAKRLNASLNADPALNRKCSTAGSRPSTKCLSWRHQMLICFHNLALT